MFWVFCYVGMKRHVCILPLQVAHWPHLSLTVCCVMCLALAMARCGRTLTFGWNGTLQMAIICMGKARFELLVFCDILAWLMYSKILVHYFNDQYIWRMLNNWQFLVCKSKWQVIWMLSVDHIFHWSISVFLNNSEHLEAFLPSWHEFKNLIMSEVSLLHSQPFTNVSFHFLIIVETVASQVLLQWLKHVCCNMRSFSMTVQPHTVHVALMSLGTAGPSSQLQHLVDCWFHNNEEVGVVGCQ